MFLPPNELKDIRIKKEDISDEIIFSKSDENDDKEETVLERYQREPRIILFKWLIAFILVLLSMRAGYLQIIKFGLYQNVAKGNSTRAVTIKSDRGIIYDKNLNPLVQNIASLDAVVIPADLPKKEAEIDKISETLSGILKIDREEIDKIFKSAEKYSSSPVLIRANIEHDKAIIIESKKEKLNGIEIEKNAIRFYENGVYFSPILGYSGKVSSEDLKSHPDYLMTDSMGKTGLEYFYEKDLRGKYGSENIEVDALGQKKRIIGKSDPLAGLNLKLHIDKNLQEKIYEKITEKAQGANYLKKSYKKSDSPMAAAAAIDPRNGGVLALISMPSYDNNLFAKGISVKDYAALVNNPDSPLLNRAIAGNYPPGSTLKPLIASAALNENIISSSKIINCPGYLTVFNYIFPDWKAHGLINIIDAIAQSSDVFFYTIGGGFGDVDGLDIEGIKKYANLFGLGEKTGIDLPSESEGLIPDKEWKKAVKKESWYLGDTYHASIGQGDVLATPLQIANYTATIANGGILYEPQIVDKIIDGANNTVEDINPVIIRKNFIDSKNIKIVKEGMRAAVTRGTARSLNELSVTSAGKTGTAQFGPNKDIHSWFTVYAPSENPEIALTVLVEGGGEGNELAVPIAKDILEWYFSDKNKTAAQ